MGLASELRKIADRLDAPGHADARRLGAPLHLVQLFQRVRELAEIGTIYDVGANRGEFARIASKCFPEAIVHAFEPLEVCQPPLRKVAGENPGMRVHAMALGDSRGTVEMFQNDYAPTSSLLPMEKRLGELWPGAAHARKTPVQLETLDALDIERRGDALLKLDVQGFEASVLKGAANTLKQTAVVMTEVLFEKLYQGQADLLTLANLLAWHGFRFLEFADQTRLPPQGRLAYADAVFVREELRFA